MKIQLINGKTMVVDRITHRGGGILAERLREKREAISISVVNLKSIEIEEILFLRQEREVIPS